MRRSILRYRSFQSNKKVGLCLLFIGLFAPALQSCQWRLDKTEVGFRTADKLKPYPIFFQDKNRRGIAARLSRGSCTSGLHVISTVIHTPLGNHLLKLKKSQVNLNHLTIDGHQITLLTRPSIWIPIDRACQNEQIDELVIGDEDLKDFQAFLSQFIPSCDLELPETDTWECKINSSSEDSIDEIGRRLSNIHRSMLRKFRRHPYLLLRRTGIAIQLYKALEDKGSLEKLDTFCAITTTSLPVELPLALRSANWQSSACNTFGNRLNSAKWGLTESFKEINMFYNMLQKSSHRGILTIKIPKSEAPSKELWVELDIKVPSNPGGISTSCYHPLYSDSRFHYLITKIGLARQSDHHLCAQEEHIEADLAFSKKYIFSTIASETEFPISNGRAKILRLPIGDYEYTVQKNSQNFIPRDQISSKKISRGSLSWGPNKSHPKVTKW